MKRLFGARQFLFHGILVLLCCPKTIHAARGAHDFTTYTLHGAVYGTGFDGNIVMTGKLDGMLQVQLNQ